MAALSAKQNAFMAGATFASSPRKAVASRGTVQVNSRGCRGEAAWRTSGQRSTQELGWRWWLSAAIRGGAPGLAGHEHTGLSPNAGGAMPAGLRRHEGGARSHRVREELDEDYRGARPGAGPGAGRGQLWASLGGPAPSALGRVGPVPAERWVEPAPCTPQRTPSLATAGPLVAMRGGAWGLSKRRRGCPSRP